MAEILTPEKIQEHMDATRSPQHRHELQWLISQVNKINHEVIVEIGVERGGTTSLWRRVFDYELMVGIDIADHKQEIKFDGIKNKFILGSSVLKETKDKLIKELNGKEIDFLFIDGSHNYFDVKNDYYMYKDLVRKDGLIFFHDIWMHTSDLNVKLDYNDGWDGSVARFWREIIADASIKSDSYHGKDMFNIGMGLIYSE